MDDDLDDDHTLLIDLHLGGPRQGPGGDAETSLAIELSGLSEAPGLRIADVGCGTGASTLTLARALDATVTAVDLVPDFLAEVERRAQDEGLAERISTRCASMDALPFAPGSLDVIWSEGAIYSIGFANGIRAWRPLLKPGGILAVSELTWFTAERPDEIHDHWTSEYPEVDTASAKMALLEASGYSPIGYFTLPEHCWLENYYRPLRQRFAEFLQRHGSSEAARAVVDAETKEIDLYERFSPYVGYGCYVARRVPD